MPVTVSVDNDLRLIVTRYSGRVTPREVLDAIGAVPPAVTRTGIYRGLATFDHTVDLSDLDVRALAEIRRRGVDVYRGLSLARGPSAAIIDDSDDARLIVPLWNAINDTGEALDLKYQLFRDPEAAFDMIGIAHDEGNRLIAGPGAPPAS